VNVEVSNRKSRYFNVAILGSIHPPPLPATYRLTVEADWPNREAIDRNDSPEAIPRETSSGSSNHK
jgi:hypothetical protein